MRRCALALALAVVGSAVACSSTQPIGTQLSDAAKTTSIKSRLAADREVNPFDVQVQVVEGEVVLTGRVKTEEQRLIAEKIAYDTDGVLKVVNLIKVGELRRSGGGGGGDG